MMCSIVLLGPVLLMSMLSIGRCDHATYKQHETLKTESMVYGHNGMRMESFITFDPSWTTPRPVVLIVPDWDGLNHYEHERSLLIAKELGYAAIGVDVYGAENHQVEAIPDRIALVTAYFRDPVLFAGRISAALEHAVEKFHFLNPDKVGLFGFCFGGTGVLTFAALGNKVAAGVAFHPGLGAVPSIKGEVVTPLLILSGSKDGGASVASVLDLEAVLTNSSATFEFDVYGHIRHAFTVWGGSDYDAFVDSRSFRAAATFLSEQFQDNVTAGYTALAAAQAPTLAFGAVDKEGGYLTMSKTFKSPIDGQVIQGELFWSRMWRGQDEARPAVVILHDANGIDAYERTRATMLVEAGYFVVVADVYGRDLQKRVNSLPGSARSGLLSRWRDAPEQFVHRILENVAFLKGVPGVDTERVGVIGYCFGGTGVINLATTTATQQAVADAGVRVGVSFHGGLRNRATGQGNITMFLSAHMGSLDDNPVDIMALQEELEARNAPGFEISRYSGARHAFTVFADARYNTRADTRSWASMMQYLHHALVHPLQGTVQPTFGADRKLDTALLHSATQVVDVAKRGRDYAIVEHSLHHVVRWRDQLDARCIELSEDDHSSGVSAAKCQNGVHKYLNEKEIAAEITLAVAAEAAAQAERKAREHAAAIAPPPTPFGFQKERIHRNKHRPCKHRSSSSSSDDDDDDTDSSTSRGSSSSSSSSSSTTSDDDDSREYCDDDDDSSSSSSSSTVSSSIETKDGFFVITDATSESVSLQDDDDDGTTIRLGGVGSSSGDSDTVVSDTVVILPN